MFSAQGWAAPEEHFNTGQATGKGQQLSRHTSPRISFPEPTGHGSSQTAWSSAAPCKLLHSLPTPTPLPEQREYFRTLAQPHDRHTAARPDYLGRDIFIGHERRCRSFPAAHPRVQALGTTGHSTVVTQLNLGSIGPSTPLPDPKAHRLLSGSSPQHPWFQPGPGTSLTYCTTSTAARLLQGDRHSARIAQVTSRAGGEHQSRFGPLNVSQHSESNPVLCCRSSTAGLRSTCVPSCLTSPTVTLCPAMTPELCSLRAQSCPGCQPRLTLATHKHY